MQDPEYHEINNLINLSEIYHEKYPVSERIDFAWKIYRDQRSSEKDTIAALNFLIYAYDLDGVSEHINDQLTQLMAEKEEYRLENPEYIPGKAVNNLQLKPGDLNINVTTSFRASDKKDDVREAFLRDELLDVNQGSKSEDEKTGTKFLNNNERAKYQVHIREKQFVQNDQPFSTSNYISHSKKGFASYILTANGQLFVFNHLDGKDNISHSSMNGGAPVVSSGEIAIENGELKAITSHSGHYRPTLFNVHRALEYFSKHGVNIQNAKVLTISDPKKVTGLDTTLEVINNRPGLVYLNQKQLNLPFLNKQFDKSQYIICGNTINYYSKSENILTRYSMIDAETVKEIKILFPRQIMSLKDEGLQYLMNKTQENPEGVFYQTPAPNMYHSLHQLITDTVNEMRHDINQYKDNFLTYFFRMKDNLFKCTGLTNNLTDNRIQLAQQFVDSIETLLKSLKPDMSLSEFDNIIQTFKTVISNAHANNDALNEPGGRLARKFEFFKTQLESIDKNVIDRTLNPMKKIN